MVALNGRRWPSSLYFFFFSLHRKYPPHPPAIVAVGFSRVLRPRTNKNARRRAWDCCFTARSGQISSFPLCVPVVCARVCFSCLADSPQLGSLCVLIPALPESPGGPSSFPTFFFFFPLFCRRPRFFLSLPAHPTPARRSPLPVMRRLIHAVHPTTLASRPTPQHSAPCASSPCPLRGFVLLPQSRGASR